MITYAAAAAIGLSSGGARFCADMLLHDGRS